MPNIESASLLGFIREERSCAYSSQTSDQDFMVARGLTEYLHYLPEFYGKDLICHIKEELAQNQETTLLDAGCGDTSFLVDLAGLYPQVRLYGISAFDYRRPASEPLPDIDYRIGDLQQVKKLFPDVRFDFITSCATFSYLGDPLAALKQCYALLKEDGIMFLDRFGVLMTQEEISRLSDFWKNHRIETSIKQRSKDNSLKHHFGLAIRRSASPHLPLPFKYNPPNREDSYMYIFTG